MTVLVWLSCLWLRTQRPSTSSLLNPTALEPPVPLPLPPHLVSALPIPPAGTVACPTCHGSPRIHRLTPDFAKALGLQPLWDEQVAARLGVWSWGRESRPADKQRLFLEYPSGDGC